MPNSHWHSRTHAHKQVFVDLDVGLDRKAKSVFPKVNEGSEPKHVIFFRFLEVLWTGALSCT